MSTTVQHRKSVTVGAKVRAEVATRYGARPDDKRVWVACYWCGRSNAGYIIWFKLRDRQKYGWVGNSGVEWDHLVPLSLDGPNTAENIVLACRHCNRSRCNRPRPSSLPPELRKC